MRPVRTMLPLVLISAFAPVLSAGCSCPEVDCLGASVAVDLSSRPEAETARICINAVCEVVSGSSGDWPAGWVALRFDAVPVTVRDDEHFELGITVFDNSGSAIASTTHQRKNDVGKCRCLAFPYRFDDSEITRAD